MGLGSEMKSLSESILESFKQRMKDNEQRMKESGEFVAEVQKTLEGFRKDHQEMADVLNGNFATLRKDLDTGEKDRLNNHKALMTDIHSTISTIQKEVGAIQGYTSGLIDQYSTERNEMAKELAAFFAQSQKSLDENQNMRIENEKLRLSEFDVLMQKINGDLKGVNDEVASIFKSTNDLLANFEKGRNDMSAELRAELSKNLTERVEYTNSLLAGFQNRLKEIGKEHNKMGEQLRKDLADGKMNLVKGESDRHNNYTLIMGGIQTTIEGISKEVMNIRKSTSNMLTDLTKDRKKGSDEWNAMQETIAQLSKSGSVPVKKEEVKKEAPKETVMEEVKKAPEKPVVEEVVEKPVQEPIHEPIQKPIQKPVEIKKEIPAEVKKEPVVALTLNEKILDYINKHPKGVKVTEMEKQLGETRMKLGYLAKNLLESGKLQKVGNLYYPVK